MADGMARDIHHLNLGPQKLKAVAILKRQIQRRQTMRVGLAAKDADVAAKVGLQGGKPLNVIIVVMGKDQDVKIVFTDADGNETVLREAVPVIAGEVVDSTCMNRNKLRAFFEQEISAAKDEGVLLSLHH